MQLKYIPITDNSQDIKLFSHSLLLHTVGKAASCILYSNVKVTSLLFVPASQASALLKNLYTLRLCLMDNILREKLLTNTNKGFLKYNKKSRNLSNCLI